jgi:plastocyanin
MGPIRTLVFIAGLSVAAASCGSDSPSSPSGGNDGTIAATLTISTTGISPKTVTVPVGSRVTIINNDTKSHNMNSDPHPEHTQCPALNVGVLASGQSRTSQNLTTARACGMHDHDDSDNANWKATITVQ